MGFKIYLIFFFCGVYLVRDFTHLWFFGDFDLFHGKKQVKKMKPLIVISAV